ncbi:hypothetical protein RclHR1_08010004 [Rhizophagus clarus]|uniref:Uncharacterized protein n=1 Tax=Rhizophagus clarus TaxID=94130 RepID=A0A2Z6RZI4_9GLOM|nr:hypothetical protein RclHR1_08010004 [Rhizophagus clarus]
MEFIENWKNQQSEIIELRTSLMQLYGSEYQISSSEFNAWKSMLRHMGCIEITPYNKNQCEIFSSDTINEARKYARLHGPGTECIEKPIFTQQQFHKDYINKLEHLRRYLKKSYEQEFEIAANGTVIHNECISHCLPYAFGVCTESHSHECVGYGQLFAIFYQLKNDIPTTLHTELDEYQEHLLYYLVIK